MAGKLFTGFCALLILTSLAAGAGSKLVLSSRDFARGADIPVKYTCTGSGISPELRIGGVPAGAKSLALMLEDPDAPGGVFTHWLVWNVAPQTAVLSENGVPPGALQGTNDFSKTGYGAPCPPSGTHRYVFKIFAVDQTLNLETGARRAEFEAALKGHVIGEAELMGRCSHR